MRNLFLTSEEAISVVHSGVTAIFAGSEDALRKLPGGNWIGGTTPYFVTEDGGLVDETRLFCSVVDEAAEARSEILTVENLPSITHGRFGSGFSYLLVPAFTDIHARYAVDGPSYPGLCDQPLMGWVTGVLLADIGRVTPKVFDGFTGTVHEDCAVVLHARLPAHKSVQLDIINLFSQGDGPEIIFPHAGFAATDCTVDGVPRIFSEYVKEAGLDPKLPLVADYAGASVNVSFQDVPDNGGPVKFYAPVVESEVYRLASPVESYQAAFDIMTSGTRDARGMLSCNCILNFLYAELEGKKTGSFVGPVTFGEIAYVLLNQTLVRLNVSPVLVKDEALALSNSV